MDLFMLICVIAMASLLFSKNTRQKINNINKKKNSKSRNYMDEFVNDFDNSHQYVYHEQHSQSHLINEMPYSAKMLLTYTEYGFYMQLKKMCDARNLLICPKVRLEDFIQVNKSDFAEIQRYRGYIKSRHVDFVITNASLHIVAALELDDNSHNRAKAQETDTFKNNLFNHIGIPLFRVKTGSNYEQELLQLFNYMNIFPVND